MSDKGAKGTTGMKGKAEGKAKVKKGSVKSKGLPAQPRSHRRRPDSADPGDLRTFMLPK